MSNSDSKPAPLWERIAPPLANTSAPRDGESYNGQIEGIRRWQEERIKRKLRGEYESAVLHLADLVSSNLDMPMRIASVRVQGAEKTRPSFLDWLIKPHLVRPTSPTSTLKDVLTSTKFITNALLVTDTFASVYPQLTRSQDVLANPPDVDLILYTRPRGRLFLKTATELGDQEGSVTVQARVRNVFGGAETLEASVSSGLRTRLAGHISLATPCLTPDLRTRAELALFAREKDWTAFSSCVEGVRGVRAAIKTVNLYTMNEWAYEAAFRHIHSLTPNASISIREDAGHSVKSAFSHSWTFDSRDDKALPSRGVLFKLYNEVAGLGGTVSFLKSTSAFQIAHSFPPINPPPPSPSSPTSHLLPVTNPSITISLSTGLGFLHPLNSSPSRSPRLSDRFTLGGPLDVRMFKQSGLGPHDGADALGGSLFWAAGLSLMSNIPKKPHWPVKAHAFLNAGRLDNLDMDLPLVSAIRNSLSRPSISAGVGLLYRLQPVRIELNFGVPLVAHRGDLHRRGFQVGIGLDFM